MSKSAQNVINQCSFGAAACLFLVGSSYCLNSLPWAVVTVVSMAYCLLWELVNAGADL